jgi:hypothetical protein
MPRQIMDNLCNLFHKLAIYFAFFISYSVGVFAQTPAPAPTPAPQKPEAKSAADKPGKPQTPKEKAWGILKEGLEKTARKSAPRPSMPWVF